MGIDVDRVLVVGAGIGGSTVAAAIAQSGREVELIEIQAQPPVLGAGIGLMANGMKLLDRIGVAEELQTEENRMTGINYWDRHGNAIEKTPYEEMTADGFTGAYAARPEISRILLAAAARQGVELRASTHITELVQDADGADVTFNDGSTDRYDLVVGFDGIASDLRARLFGEDAGRIYTGFAAWRVTMQPPRVEEFSYSGLHQGVGVKAAVVSLNPQVMFLSLISREPEGVWYEKDKLVPMLRERLESFTGPLAEVSTAVTDQHTVLFNPLDEIHLPLPWHEGRAVVLGDAAHASTPHLSAGGGQAIEDAIVLAEMLDAEGGLDLSAFEQRRWPRANWVQETSRRLMLDEMDSETEAKYEARMARLVPKVEAVQAEMDAVLGAPV